MPFKILSGFWLFHLMRSCPGCSMVISLWRQWVLNWPWKSYRSFMDWVCHGLHKITQIIRAYAAGSLVREEPCSGRQESGLSPWAIPLDRDHFNSRDPDPSNRGHFCKSVKRRRDLCRKGMGATLTNPFTGEDLSRTHCSGAQTYKVRCGILASPWQTKPEEAIPCL